MTWNSLTLVRQREPSDCGLACLAMVRDIPYEQAQHFFEYRGYDRRRGRRMPGSTNFTELTQALTDAGIGVKRKRFRTWVQLPGLAIVKVAVQRTGNWHWVVTQRTEQGLIVLYDPAFELPAINVPPGPASELARQLTGIDDWLPINNYAPQGCYLALTRPDPALLPPVPEKPAP